MTEYKKYESVLAIVIFWRAI